MGEQGREPRPAAEQRGSSTQAGPDPSPDPDPDPPHRYRPFLVSPPSLRLRLLQCQISECSSLKHTYSDYFLGSYAKMDTTKTFTLPAHTHVRVQARVHFIDNWQGESVYLKVGDNLVWTQSHFWCDQVRAILFAHPHPAHPGRCVLLIPLKRAAVGEPVPATARRRPGRHGPYHQRVRKPELPGLHVHAAGRGDGALRR